ncbi:VIT domain-containing protein [Rhodopseudomonas boonkerdii]|uniref:VIT domain-containing protein n=1 Tax=Rhodopseudomonas boonkerdii TaxID=475937 RepID=UPI001E522FD8|nr:VIT domain-containing protein [Rhodopseudomonas boonkerdii]
MERAGNEWPSSGHDRLTDPLAPFLRPAPLPTPPLLLSRTNIHLRLAPPLARLIVERHFSNTEAVPIEAVLTLPPAVDKEVVYATSVEIGGHVWHAHAQARRRAENSYDAATVDGNRAILIEQLKDGWRTLSIAGIQPGEAVSVRTDSVVALPPGMTILTLRPGADPDRVVPALPDHLLPRLTDIAHDMALIVEASPDIDIRVDADTIPRSTPITITPAPIAFAIDVPASFGQPTAAQDGAALAALQAAERIAALASSGASTSQRDEIRALALSANLMTPETSLVFTGPDGEASGILPAMRKVALMAGKQSMQPVPAAPPSVPSAAPPPPEVEPTLSPPSSERPGRRRLSRPRIALQPPPLITRWRNWLAHRLHRAPREQSLPDLGVSLVQAATGVTWRPDGLLALRSGDPAHLPPATAFLIREIARHAPVREAADGLQLSPEHIALILLAIAAGPANPLAVHALADLFPDDRSGTLKPALRSLANRFGLPC